MSATVGFTDLPVLTNRSHLVPAELVDNDDVVLRPHGRSGRWCGIERSGPRQDGDQGCASDQSWNGERQPPARPAADLLVRSPRRMFRIAFAVLAIAEGQGGDRPGDRDEAEQTAEDSSGQHGWMAVEDGLPPGPAKPQRNTDHRETQKQPDDREHNAAATSRLRHAVKCRAGPSRRHRRGANTVTGYTVTGYVH